ncbi:MAG: acyl-CoA dehydrogenase, partial [Aeromicrobium sp.]|nr:acyl-CoA dehydrogenase [Aeromicrobium sp.]
WDRTREVIDIRLQDAQPAAVLDDPKATSGALLRAMAVATAADSCGAARSVTERTIAYMKCGVRGKPSRRSDLMAPTILI